MHMLNQALNIEGKITANMTVIMFPLIVKQILRKTFEISQKKKM